MYHCHRIEVVAFLKLFHKTFGKHAFHHVGDEHTAEYGSASLVSENIAQRRHIVDDFRTVVEAAV